MNRSGPQAPEAAAELVVVELQVRQPTLRSLLVSGLECPGAELFADHLIHAMRAAGMEARRLRLETAAPEAVQAHEGVAKSRDSGPISLNHAREQLTAAGTSYTVAATSDFLTNPTSAVLASIVDGVLLLARNRHTRESALVAAGRRAEDLSSRLVGAVYVEGWP